MPDVNLTNTTWKLDRELNCSIGQFELGDEYSHTFNINFTSNGNTYNSLRLYRHWYEEEMSEDAYDDETGDVIDTNTWTEEYEDNEIYYGNSSYYNGADDWDGDDADGNGGYESPYQTIIITGGTDTTNSDLITWLENNATQQSQVITDLTGYTWVGNSSLSNIAPSGTDITSKDGMAENYAINFTCNNVSYTYFNILDRDYSPYGYFYSNEALNSDDGTTVVYTESWISDNFKTIQIIGGTDATNSNLIAWLQNNGTLSAPVVQPIGKIFVGTKQVKKIYIGTKKVKKVYIGTKLSYEDNN